MTQIFKSRTQLQPSIQVPISLLGFFDCKCDADSEYSSVIARRRHRDHLGLITIHSPWIEMVDGFVRVWSDRGMDSTASAFHLDFEQSTFETELSKVQQDLSTFLVKIEAWANKIKFLEPSKLSSKFDECFAISQSPLLVR